MGLINLPGGSSTNPGWKDTVFGKAESAVKEAATTSTSTTASTGLVSTYSGDNNNRLIDVTPVDAETDDSRIAYLKLIAPDGAFVKDFPQDMAEDRAFIESLLGELKGKYQKFIITALGVSSQEKMQILPTFGDAFAATFTGKDPTILSVTGYLVFDYAGKAEKSWYTSFLNAYEYFLRGSRLAKWRAKMTLTLPDLCTYTGYMTSLSTQFSADNDSIVSMQFSYLVTGQTIFKSTVESKAKEKTKDAETGTAATPATNATVEKAVPTIELDKWVPNDLDVLGSLPTDYENQVRKATEELGNRTVTSSLIAGAGAQVELAKAKATVASVAQGMAVNPATILKQSQSDMFRTTMGPMLQNVINPVLTSASKVLGPIATSFLMDMANKKIPMLGAVEAVVTKNVPGLMGNVTVAPSKLTSVVDQNVSNVALRNVGHRSIIRPGGSKW